MLLCAALLGQTWGRVQFRLGLFLLFSPSHPTGSYTDAPRLAVQLCLNRPS